MKPRYSDKRYPNGYRMSHDTDIRRTFERIRRQQAEQAKQDAEIKAERVAKVQNLSKRRTAA